MQLLMNLTSSGLTGRRSQQPEATDLLCAGIDYTLPGKYASRRHFSGNFWWTTGAHYASLPEAIGGDYLGPEFHVLLRNESRVAQVWATGIGGGGMCVPQQPLTHHDCLMRHFYTL